jgi:hypothetical protein
VKLTVPADVKRLPIRVPNVSQVVHRGTDPRMSEHGTHEQPADPARQTEQEDQQYPDHGHPDEQRKKVGLPPEDGQTPPKDAGSG